MRTYAWLGGMAVVALGFWACSSGSDTTPTTTTGTTSVGGGGSGHGGGGTGGTTTGGTGGVGGGPAVCGNNVQEAGEECDDGNTNDKDGCEHDCTLPKCGNGIPDPGEVCWGGQMVDYDLPSMAVGYLLATDCDGDGHEDILVLGDAMVHMYSPLVALHNDGAGVLGAPNLIGNLSGSFPSGMALGAFDANAPGDLVVAFAGGGSLQTYLGDGNCGFAAGINLALGAHQPHGVAVVPIDADAIDDLLAPTTGTPPQLAYYRSTSSPPPTANFVNAGSSNPTAIVAGAIDANGTLAVVVTDRDAGKVVVRMITASGPSGIANVYPGTGTTGAGPAALALGDINGDLVPEIVTANNGGNSVSVLVYDGVGSFELAGPDVSIVGDPAQGWAPTGIALVDVDGDGDLDVITINDGKATNSTIAPSITLLLNDGSGNLTLATSVLFPLVEKSFPIALTHPATDLAVVDLNHDGALDLVMTTLVSASSPEESHVTVLLANP